MKKNEIVRNKDETVRNQHGGVRPNSGRKLKYGEPTIAIRIPQSLVDFVQYHVGNVHNQDEKVQNQADSQVESVRIQELERELETVRNQNKQLSQALAELRGLWLESVLNQDNSQIENVQSQDEKVQNQASRQVETVHNHLFAVKLRASELAGEGKGFSEIARLLEKEGYRNGKGKPHSKGAVHRWLKASK